jgi:maleylacetoacetate isomerase
VPSPRLIPEPRLLRTSVLEVAMAIATDMHQMNNMRTQQYLSKRLQVTAEQKEAWVHHWWHTGVSAVEALLPKLGGGWTLGEGPTLADCCLVPQVANALRGGFDFAGYPKVWRAYQHCMTHPAFQRAAPSAQPDHVPH